MIYKIEVQAPYIKDKKELINLRYKISRKVPPSNFMAKHKILSQYIAEGTTKSGLKMYWERDITVEQWKEQCDELKQLITN